MHRFLLLFIRPPGANAGRCCFWDGSSRLVIGFRCAEYRKLACVCLYFGPSALMASLPLLLSPVSPLPVLLLSLASICKQGLAPSPLPPVNRLTFPLQLLGLEDLSCFWVVGGGMYMC